VVGLTVDDLDCRRAQRLLIVATDQRQADLTLNLARRMVELNPVCFRCGCPSTATGSKCRAMVRFEIA
jgi:hypothetical protein